MIAAIAYAACYVYSPTGAGAVWERSGLIKTLLKAGDASFIVKYALRVGQQAMDSPLLAGFFAATDILVPVPGSELCTPRGVWAAEERALLDEGIGAAAWRGLRRAQVRDRRTRSTADCEPALRVFHC